MKLRPLSVTPIGKEIFMAEKNRMYQVNYHERGADPEETKRWPRYQVVKASNATLAISKAKTVLAQDYCLEKKDIVIDEVTIT